MLVALTLRIVYIQTADGDFLRGKAFEQQTRDRFITPKRGSILDRNMTSMADVETVASVSVIHNQIKDEEKVARALSGKLEMDYDEVFKKVSKKVALERVKTKVDKKTADEIRELALPGVVVDDDIKRVYPFASLASQVIGFVGRDNQGIIGLEAKYEKLLKGERGKILTATDVRGIELEGGMTRRVEAAPGGNLVTTLDVILQLYCEQTLDKALVATNAKRGAIILMNPQDGAIYVMANKPSFDLNDPFTINSEELKLAWNHLTEKEKNDALNQMWRNFSINDTYEPGSTFKIITSIAGLEEGVVAPDSPFSCSGSYVVGGRAIKCWRSPRSHGSQTFTEGVYNSCNPVFMQVAERLGPETFYEYLMRFGFKEKTGIDVPGESTGIMHKLENVGPVELATMSFGQSFQITPLQLLSSASTVVNGGRKVTPHFVSKTVDDEGVTIEEFQYANETRIVSKGSSDAMRKILEGVVSVGTGKRTYIPGYRIGGKTATSEKLPRHSGKYIASFMAFAPADDPKVIALVLIDEPQGAYYGGAVAGPLMKEVLSNALPYLGVEPVYTAEEAALPETAKSIVPDVRQLMSDDAAKIVKDAGLTDEKIGAGDIVTEQFPLPGEEVNKGTKVILFLTPSESDDE
ncbi:MAG: PASTA domain-containing protein [Clostridiales bacterium]|nr:PASTA domain-containing protein [Clostridiales bacterium]